MASLVWRSQPALETQESSDSPIKYGGLILKSTRINFWLQDDGDN